MSSIYSYVLRFDDGAAPNPFWGVCTLAICKPVIRRKAQLGSWIIGTGSKASKCNDGKTYNFSGMLVYAMKIDNIKTLSEYDEFCLNELPNKIPDLKSKNWKMHLGDAIYDYSKGQDPTKRNGKHNEKDKIRDLSGKNVLLSKHFYYFGEHPILLPPQFQVLVKKNQGHKIIRNKYLISEFEKWLTALGSIGMKSNPQLHFQTICTTKNMITCSTDDIKKHSHGSKCGI